MENHSKKVMCGGNTLAVSFSQFSPKVWYRRTILARVLSKFQQRGGRIFSLKLAPAPS